MSSKAKVLTLLVPAVMAVSLLATPVEAHGKRHHRHAAAHQRDRSHGDHHRHRVRARHHRDHDRFRIPQRIHRHDARRFRGFYRTSSYYRPHRHRHFVYDFPVWTRRGYVYRPHHYCGGALFSRGRVEYHGRHVSFGFNF